MTELYMKTTKTKKPVTDKKASDKNFVTDEGTVPVSFKKGDRVVLIDTRNTAGLYEKGHVGTVVKFEDDRVYLTLDGDNKVLSGNKRRFRLQSSLESVLK